jgi:hypothetical protein
MPENLQSASTGANDLYFADDLEGTVFKLRENSVYSADEVSDEGQTPEFGRWLPATVPEARNGGGTTVKDVWLVAVGELIQELQRLDDPANVHLEVTRCEKSGPRQTDPYEVNVEPVDPDQQRF